MKSRLTALLLTLALLLTALPVLSCGNAPYYDSSDYDRSR